MMNWILLVMAAIAAVVVAMLLGGAMAPRTRTSVRSLTVPRSVADVYTCVREVDGPPRWCPDLPTMRVTDEQAPHQFTCMLLDDDGAEMGRWLVTVTTGDDVNSATMVSVSESVTVNNLVLRFLRSLSGDGARPQRFLEAVARQLGVSGAVRAV